MVSLIKKYFSYAVCTFFGAGYFPLAPGSFSSILAVLLLYLLQPSFIILALLLVITFTGGVILSKEIEKNDGKDPAHIVIDELTGQWLTFLFISNTSLLIAVAGLILFRFFDILKPLGIDKLQNLKNGWGVMLDDVLAGVYSNIILHMLIFLGIII